MVRNRNGGCGMPTPGPGRKRKPEVLRQFDEWCREFVDVAGFRRRVMQCIAFMRDPKDRFDALMELVERGYGRPRQSIEVRDPAEEAEMGRRVETSLALVDRIVSMTAEEYALLMRAAAPAGGNGDGVVPAD